MSAYVGSYAESSRPPAGRAWLVVFALILLAAIALSAHALERHGSAAGAVRGCLDGNAPLETWSNPQTGRSALICNVGDKFGLMIVEDGKEVTSFFKEKLKGLDQVRKYLLNRGYVTLK